MKKYFLSSLLALALPLSSSYADFAEVLISSDARLDLTRAFSGQKDNISFENSISANDVATGYWMITSDIHPALGADLKIQNSKEGSVAHILSTFDVRFGGMFISWNNSSAVGVYGTVGLRDDQTKDEHGQLGQAGGVVTEITEKLNYQVGARIAFYISFVKGHAQLVFLPDLNEYEFTSMINVDLAKINRTLYIADNMTIEGGQHGSTKNNQIDDFLRVIFSLPVGSYNLNNVGGNVNLDYGVGVRWNQGPEKPKYDFYLGVRLK